MATKNLSPCELEIAYFHRPSALDPFGIQAVRIPQEKVWERALALDQVFTRKTVTKGIDFGSGEMFYCKDCDSFRKCQNRNHASYIRCFGSGDEHCFTCS